MVCSWVLSRDGLCSGGFVHPFSCVFFPSFVTNTRLEVNCSFHCWQGPGDLPPQWVLETLDRLPWSGCVCVCSPCLSETGCPTEISNQFQFSAVWLPVGWHTKLILGQKSHPEMLDTSSGLWSQVSLPLVCVPVLPHCWLTRRLVCLNKHWLGIGQQSHLSCHYSPPLSDASHKDWTLWQNPHLIHAHVNSCTKCFTTTVLFLCHSQMDTPLYVLEKY